MPSWSREPTRSSIPNETKRGGLRSYPRNNKVDKPRQCPQCDVPMLAHSFALDDWVRACSRLDCGWMTCPFCGLSATQLTHKAIRIVADLALFTELNWDERNTTPDPDEADDGGPYTELD